MPTQYLLFKKFISPLFNQVGKLRTSSHLQLRPGQDKAKQFDTYNDTVTHEINSQLYSIKSKVYTVCANKGGKAINSPWW